MEFQDFYQSNYREAYRVAYSVSPLYADDAVQDVFTYLFEHQEKCTTPYLCRAVYHRALYLIHGDGQSLPDTWEGEDSSYSPEPWVVREESNETFAQLVSTTPYLTAMAHSHQWTSTQRSWLCRHRDELQAQL